MKKVFSIQPGESRDIILLTIRVAIAALMLVHGLPKLQLLLSGGSAGFPAILGMSSTLSLSLTVFAEVICSLFILLGLATRMAAVPLIVTMLVAVFVVHGNDPFGKQELGIHYLLIYGVLLFTGSGKYSADYYISERLDSKASIQGNG